MKITLNIGDEVKVVAGKLAGKQAKVVFIDKKAKRVRLDGLKVVKPKGKKGGKEIHGTFSLSSVKAVVKEAPQANGDQAA